MLTECETNIFLPCLVEKVFFCFVLFEMGAKPDLIDLKSALFFFFLCFFSKSGHNIGNVREKMRELVKVLCNICPASKVLAYIVDGIRSKNNRTRIEAVEHIGSMIDRYGIGVSGLFGD